MTLKSSVSKAYRVYKMHHRAMAKAKVLTTRLFRLPPIRFFGINRYLKKPVFSLSTFHIIFLLKKT